MTHFLLMVHSEFSENFIQKIVTRIPSVNIITIPFALCTANAQTYIQELHNILNKNKISAKEINYVCVESNYGAPSSPELNTVLIEHLISICTTARIAVYSGTSASLAKALVYDFKSFRLEVIGKGADTTTEISSHLGHPLTKEESERIFTVPKFRDSITQQNLEIGCENRENLEYSRIRTRSDPQTFIPLIEHRDRSPSLPSFTPMYEASSTEESNIKPTKDNSSTKKLTQTSANS